MASKKTIAHLITDEKFPDSAYDQFESVAPGVSEYYIISRKPLSHLKKIQPVFTTRLALDTGILAKKLLRYTSVIVHGLSYLHQVVIYQLLQKSNRPQIVWIGMGFDYYDLVYPDRKDLFLPETRKLINENVATHRRSVSRTFRGLAGIGERKIFHHSNSKEDIVREIDFFAPVLTNEYALVAKALGNRKFPRLLDWNYGKNSRLFDKKDGPRIDPVSESVVIGNSGASTNNHLDAFEMIDSCPAYRPSVSSPLSYGDKFYSSLVEAKGIRQFGARFSTIKNFLDYSEYVRLLSHFPVAVMNHRRQQAGGNIGILMYMGSTIFLREENPLYDYYKERGAVIFSIQSLERDPGILKIRLYAAQVEKNREILRGLKGWDANVEKTKTLLQALN